VLRWAGPAASNLLAVNGLYWPIAISETHMQIGCQNHKIDRWVSFSEDDLAAMDPHALAFMQSNEEMIKMLIQAKQGVKS
jgi:hypothetical protein